MPFDFVIANARLPGQPTPVDVGVANGLIAAIAPSLTFEGHVEDASGGYLCSGFVDSHIHLDKAGILGRCTICEGTLAEAVRETARAKAGFTVEDVYARAAIVLERAILQGTTLLRTFVEIDPRAGFRSFDAIRQLKADYAWAIDIEICAFAQEGLTQEPETEAMLAQALADGADLVGGCPYTDPDPKEHIRLIFDLAERFGTAVDFHLDFDLDPENSNLPSVISETMARGYSGRVSVGHVTKLSAMPPQAVSEIGSRLADAGVAVTVLPSTDLFLTGRDRDHLVPRGVAPALDLAKLGVVTSIATNNVMNPFTPYGDASLIRMANLYANVAQASLDADMLGVFAMVTDGAARLMGRERHIKIGAPADMILIDGNDPAEIVREIRPVLAGWKSGRKTFERPRGRLIRP
ncbi:MULTISPECIES: amidohydrolase family protein [unclassified Rhizobium]|uniref:amidohydrolase family protein n=1 Tax=unclassified Rhizobium TaxID=2613769 RepID=UPI001ADC03E1|nr:MULTISPECIES: amidohydrolase family protein [unclassified Rhizobium]MBO9100744.1 amidohydrolase family protein [Rhizobium sp. L58/93]MBO9135892.1 amidohydrolase family protein [Rhizobium sp. B209b/85]MBO9171204.1 amidohydrolase family protein [Rhizobium sp. L245/93]MBO9187073.1 amidohydrolase family protein [Rhizobium sp. E27B/91]QXZ88047.1 amidohydrolase family protein [Rhizobium sp. K1/93]